MKRIADPTFKYVPACSTDIRKTFERARWELKRAEQERAKVTPITKQRERA